MTTGIRESSGECGAALALALLALVVIGALAAGAFFAAIEDQRLAENTRRLAQSLGAAEVAADDLLTSWSPATYDTLSVYPSGLFAIGTAQTPVTTPGRSGTSHGTIYRLNRDLFFIDVTGRSGGMGARQRIGVLARLLPIDLPVPAALTAGGPLTISAGALVSGTGAPPPAGWSRCQGPVPPSSDVPGVRTAIPPGVSGGTVAGRPAILEDSSVGATTFEDLGPISYASLVSLASIRLPPGAYQAAPSYLPGGSCNRGDPQNWGGGSLGSPCAEYLPVVHISGNAAVHGLRGQGVLLVDGDLDLGGPLEFAGVIIVQGSLRVIGAPGNEVHIYGTVMTHHDALVDGEVVISYSKCFANAALSGISLVALLRSRGWVQLY